MTDLTVNAVAAVGHTRALPTHQVPKLGERPDVEVNVNGVWCPGELRMWTQGDDDVWSA